MQRKEGRAQENMQKTNVNAQIHLFTDSSISKKMESHHIHTKEL